MAVKLDSEAADESRVAGERSRYGLLVSALGAAMLVVSVFLPWYGVSLTSAGAALAQQTGGHVATQLGGAALQAQLPSVHGAAQALTGVQLGTVSGEDAVKGITVALLVLAGLGMLDAMLPLARSVGQGAGGAVVLLGIVASALVVFRMVSPPPAGEAFALSLREGAWLSLLGALMMMLGGMWPRAMPALGLGESGEAFATLSAGR